MRNGNKIVYVTMSINTNESSTSYFKQLIAENYHNWNIYWLQDIMRKNYGCTIIDTWVTSRYGGHSGTMLVLPYTTSRPRIIITRRVNRKTWSANLYSLANDNKDRSYLIRYIFEPKAVFRELKEDSTSDQNNR